MPRQDGSPEEEPQQPDQQIEGILIALVPALRSRARRLIGPNLRPSLDEDDLVQSTLLDLLQARRNGKYRFDATRQFKRFAYAHMRRIAATRARQARQPLELVPVVQLGGPYAHDAGSQTCILRVEACEILDKLRTYFDGQSWCYMVLHFVKGHSASDAAEQVGLTVKAVQKRIERQRAALPQELVQLAFSLLGRPRLDARKRGWGGWGSLCRSCIGVVRVHFS